jgi:hypothetical protein
MRAIVLLAICLTLASGRAAAGHWVAEPDVVTGPEPSTTTWPIDCRIENEWNSSAGCTATFWTYGGWCAGDEVTAFFDAPSDPCLTDCSWRGPFLHVESAEVGFRIVGQSCNGGYPATTLPFDGQYVIYAIDPVLSTPDCPIPSTSLLDYCESVVVTIPAHTATSSTDPARSFNVVFPFPGWWCFFDRQPVFGAFRWVAWSVPESSHVYCGQGGSTSCAWWYPGLRGRNGTNPATACAVPCTQYYRNPSMYGPDWIESVDAGLARQTDFAHWLNLSCSGTPPNALQKTTWGKLKSLMNR